MSPKAKTEKLISDALGLPREVRAFLAEKLLESLDFEESFEVSPEWRHEIERRCAELDTGAKDHIPGEQVMRDARNALKQ